MKKFPSRLTAGQVAREVGVSRQIIQRWRRDRRYCKGIIYLYAQTMPQRRYKERSQCRTPPHHRRVLARLGVRIVLMSSALKSKWLKQYVPKGCTMHSFRHSTRDRLRTVQCPADIVDQIGGWATDGVGQGYGSGYPLEVLQEWMSKATETFAQ